MDDTLVWARGGWWARVSVAADGGSCRGRSQRGAVGAVGGRSGGRSQWRTVAVAAVAGWGGRRDAGWPERDGGEQAASQNGPTPKNGRTGERADAEHGRSPNMGGRRRRANAERGRTAENGRMRERRGAGPGSDAGADQVPWLRSSRSTGLIFVGGGWLAWAVMNAIRRSLKSRAGSWPIFFRARVRAATSTRRAMSRPGRT